MKNYLYALVTDQRNDFFAQSIKLFLFLLSLLYGLIIRVSAFLYSINPYRAPCKVISIGNITLGGTGKTSLVELIARFLEIEGHKVVVISRGYKNKTGKPVNRPTGKPSMGDEPDMLYQNLGGIPVIADKDRVRAIKKAISEYKADTVVLDDAMQQWRIKKDLEIITIDAGDPFGNKNMLPRGILREPLRSLKRADIFILTKTNLSPDIHKTKELLIKVNPEALVVESMHLPTSFYEISKHSEALSLDALRSESVVLISGIGDPASFEKLVASLGINIGLSFRFSDHHNYTDVDISKIISTAKEKNIRTIVTTEKDAVRLNGLQSAVYSLRPNSVSSLRILVLRIELGLKDEQGFLNRLSRVYST